MEHSDLIQEMPHIEQMPTQDRLILAKRRRTHQLKVYQQREKEYNRKPPKNGKSNKRSIFFDESVVLLEAAARNDIDEGNERNNLFNNSVMHIFILGYIVRCYIVVLCTYSYYARVR